MALNVQRPTTAIQSITRSDGSCPCFSCASFIFTPQTNRWLKPSTHQKPSCQPIPNPNGQDGSWPAAERTARGEGNTHVRVALWRKQIEGNSNKQQQPTCVEFLQTGPNRQENLSPQ